MNTALIENLNWEDITTDLIPTKKKTNNTSANGTFKSDLGVSVNYNCAKKITSKYAHDISSKLCVNKKNAYMFDGGKLNGKSICIKVRRNVYNAGGNFTLSSDDLRSDYIAIYTYQAYNKTGYWYICDMSIVRKEHLRKHDTYYICPEKIIMDNAFKVFNIHF